MYKAHKYIIFAIYILGFLLFFIFNIRVNNLVVNGLTIISILLGFHFVALSTLYGRKYIKRMVQKVDTKKCTQTQLQTLISYFKNSVKCGLLTMLIFIVYIILLDNNSNNIVYLYVLKISSSSIMPLLLINFLFVWLILKTFLKGLLLDMD